MPEILVIKCCFAWRLWEEKATFKWLISTNIFNCRLCTLHCRGCYTQRAECLSSLMRLALWWYLHKINLWNPFLKATRLVKKHLPGCETWILSFVSLWNVSGRKWQEPEMLHFVYIGGMNVLAPKFGTWTSSQMWRFRNRNIHLWERAIYLPGELACR